MSLRKIIFINFLLFLSGLFIVELIFGNWIFSDRFDPILITKNIKKNLTQNPLYDDPNRAWYTRDKYGLRGNHINPNNIDLLTVGGSTTDQRQISDEDTWQSLIGNLYQSRAVPLTIANAGVDGQSTCGHILNWHYWFSKIPDFAPKHVLYYVGINDFYVTKEDHDKAISQLRHHGSMQVSLFDNSIFYYFYRIASGLLRVYNNDTLLGHLEIDFSSPNTWVESLPLVKDHQAFIADRLDNYRERLRILADITKKHGAQPIFATQRINTQVGNNVDSRFLNKTISYQGQQINGHDIDIIMRLFNKALMTECEESHLNCIDLDANITLSRQDFYDYVHPNRQGTKKVAYYLYNELQKIIE